MHRRSLVLALSLVLSFALPAPTQELFDLSSDAEAGASIPVHPPFQISWFPNIGSGAPSGNCGQSQIYQDWANGQLYSCKVVAGTGTWQLVGGSSGPTANTTVPSIPYLSAANVYSDSPAFRDGADTLSIRDGGNTETLNVYDAYFGALSDGLAIIGSGVIQNFGTGGNLPNAAFSINSTRNDGTATLSLSAGVNGQAVFQDSATRFLKSVGGTLTAGVGWVPVFGTIATPDTDRTASLTATTILTAPHTGLYHVHIAVISSNACATPGLAGVTVGLTWTDAIGAKTIATLPLEVNGSNTLTGTVPLGDTTSFGTGDVNIKVAVSQDIQVSTSLTGCTLGTAKYQLDGAVTELR